MPKFKVWDEINGDEESASEIDAGLPHYAAEKYAAEDQDGQGDCLYSVGHPIMVRDETGALRRYNVIIEYEPLVTATEVPL